MNDPGTWSTPSSDSSYYHYLRRRVVISDGSPNVSPVPVRWLLVRAQWKPPFVYTLWRYCDDVIARYRSNVSHRFRTPYIVRTHFIRQSLITHSFMYTWIYIFFFNKSVTKTVTTHRRCVRPFFFAFPPYARVLVGQ